MSTEYRNSNTLIAYPFRDDAAGLQRSAGVATAMPLGVFVDAAFEVPYSLAASRLYLMACYYVDADTLRVAIGDGTTTLVDVTLAAAGTYTLGTATGSGITARLVAESSYLRQYLAAIGGDVVYGMDLPFEVSTQEIVNPQVLSFTLYNNGPDAAPDQTGIAGDVVFLGGYNVDITQDVPEGDLTTIELAAVPGAGIGQRPCEQPAAVVSNVPPGMTPNKGNLEVAGDACYAVVPHPGTGLIQIQGLCDACCTCDDYTDMLDQLRVLAARVAEVQADLDAGHAAYESGVTDFNGIIAPGYTRVTMTVNGMRGSDWAGGVPDRGSPNWMRMVITFTNRRANPVSIQWNATFMHPTTAVTIEDVCWEYKGNSGKGFIGSALPAIARDSQLSVTVLCRVELTAWATQPEWRVQVKATAREYATNATDVMEKLLVVV